MVMLLCEVCATFHQDLGSQQLFGVRVSSLDFEALSQYGSTSETDANSTITNP
jgi:hypothetical protein